MRKRRVPFRGKETTMKKISLISLLCICMVCSLALGLISLSAQADSTALTAEEIDSILNTETDASQITSPFIEVSGKVRSSVVGVNNYQRPSSTYYYFGGYGNRQQPQEKLYATGSGVVVTELGHILTNYHVVEGASRITVTLEGDENEHEAILAGQDENLDLAVLYVADLERPAVPLGDSDQIQVGEWAIVIGNPLGEEFARTVTVGVVSALDREVTDSTYDRYGRRTSITNKMIQVDAAINSGNSGGGMFNMLGQLMGIPARKYTSNRNSFFSTEADVDNIGMCIPINEAKPLLRSVLESWNGSEAQAASAASGDLTGKPRMGITVLTLRNASGSSLPNGAYIVSVETGSPADEAGLKAGDIVVAVDDNVVTDQNKLTEYVGKHGAGDTLSVKVFRLEGITEIVDLDDWTVDLTALSQMKDGEYIDLSLELKIIDKIQTSLNK